MTSSCLLENITVVSLEQYISAPYCTQILADAGATVIKVERPGGDPRRHYDPVVHVAGQALSGGFASYNRGKESVVLDLTVEEDHEALFALLLHADVLVSNLRPGALERLGLRPADLRSVFPGLVVCEITGFGTTGGPAAEWPAFDSVIQAMSGMSSLIGSSADDAPQLAPMGTLDILSGTWAALGILLALLRRERTGIGTHVDAAMLDIGVALLERPLALFEFSGLVQTRGTDAFSPVGSFRAADGRWLSIVIPTDDMWHRCCDAMGRPDLADSAELDSVLKRASSMKGTVLPALEQWAISNDLTAEQVVDRMRAKGQPVGVVATIDEVRSSAQLAHRELFVPLLARSGDEDIVTDLRLPTMPLLFDGERSRPGAVPSLGDHSPETTANLRGAETPW